MSAADGFRDLANEWEHTGVMEDFDAPVRSGGSGLARLYALLMLAVLGSALLTPLLLVVVLAWPTWTIGYRAGWRLAGWQRHWRWVA